MTVGPASCLKPSFFECLGAATKRVQSLYEGNIESLGPCSLKALAIPPNPLPMTITRPLESIIFNPAQS